MRYSLFIIAFFSTFWVSAQRKKDERDTSNYIQQVNRIEFEIDERGSSHYIISGGETGLLLAVETNVHARSGYEWHLHALDSSLNKLWTKILVKGYESTFTGYDFYEGKYYMLFSNSVYQDKEFTLHEIDAETGEIESYDINTVFPISLTEFEVLDDAVLLCGHTNYRPAMLVFDFVQQKPKVVPGIYEKSRAILDLVIDDDKRTFTVILSERTDQKRYTLKTKTFTASGDLIQENTIVPGDKKNIVDGVSTSFFGGYQYMAGTYSKYASSYSLGLYLARFANGRQQFIKYHEYALLDNFFGYMSDKREERVKQRIKRKMEKGKTAKFSYRLLVHDIIKRGDEYLLVGEAYYPKYSNYSSDYYGPYSNYSPNFVGYNFTHAVVVAFDRNGAIIWDNSFEIDNVLTYSLDEFVSVNIYEDKIVLMYLEENLIHSKVIEGHEIVEGKTFNPVKLAFEGDEVKSQNPDNEGLKSWYDKTMYAYGEQRIKNAAGTGGRINRDIFYINKVQYHQEEN